MEYDQLVTLLVMLISMLAALFGIVGALKTGVLKRVKFGSFELEATKEERQQAKALVERMRTSFEGEVPYETEQLAQYYAQILAQSKISFWFSLIFASLGFVVIILAGFLYKDGNIKATYIQVFAGIIMDSVSALFFVQSRSAQKSMGEFFDKLRKDREQLESRRLCDSIENEMAKDALKIELSLHYANLPNAESISGSIIQSCLTNKQKDSQITP